MDIIYLKSILAYDPETGLFTWLVARGRMAVVGQVAGAVTRKGDIRICIDGKYYRAHRLAWFYTFGVWPNDQIDHVDLNKQNNKVDNLREATNGQNGANKRRYGNNKSGYKGVRYVVRLNRWVAQIKQNNRVVHIGCFDDPVDAHTAYANKAKELHGEFARAA